ncbi:ABC transporter permease [Bosea lathyri]|jgi:polar amino acid transport system permease protein|uniref:Amino acid ABC transporter membrane protein 2, PAAT family n=1 Tax=Bosea lathyri TaxID=1036778 RepID=A0A1H6BTR5_9HYPH|nr:ABC transporter permease [Bosea lathyri]SEG64098.1 amino acid ABC transporter membrane protein 2, PAAT family [Bosea lathyri]
MSWCEFPGWLVGSEVFQNYGCRMFSGLGITFQLVAISVVLGFAIAVGLAITRLYGPRWAQVAVNGYTTFFRGTPLLCQLFLIYYGLGQFRLFWQDVGLWWFFREPFYCAVLAFTINTAAYQTEILRGAIQSIPRGQFEGALSLGLHRWATLRHVIMPQAMILALRPLGNELIVTIKVSAIASLVTLFDLMGATRLAFARSFDLSIYLYAALIYLMMVEVIRRVWDRVELRLTRHMALR